MTTGINLGSVDIRRTTMGPAGIQTRVHDRLGIAKIGRIHDRLMRAATGGLCGFDADGELVLAVDPANVREVCDE